MATDKERENQEKIEESKNRANQYAKEQRSLSADLLVDTREILGVLRRQADVLGKIEVDGVKQIDASRSLRSLATSINKLAQESVDLTSQNLLLLETEKDIEKQITKNKETQRRLETEAQAAKSSITSLEKRNLNLIVEQNEALEDGNIKRLESLIDQENANKSLIQTLSKVGDATYDLLEDVKFFNQNAESAKNSFVEISKIPTIQMFEGLSKGTKDIPFLSEFFNDALDKSKEIAKESAVIVSDLQQKIDRRGSGITADYLKEIGLDQSPLLKGKGKGGSLGVGAAAADTLRGQDLSKLLPNTKIFSKSISAAFSKLGPVITKALGPIGIIIEVIQALVEADKEVVEIQKSFAASRSEAMGIRTELAGAAAASGNINITTTKLLGTLTSISDQFGFIAKFSKDTLVTATKLTEQVGLSADAAGQLAAASVATGTSLEENYENVLGASYELQRQKGVQFDLRKILEATAKVTGQVRANLGSNPVEIAKAVTQAKLFGAEMDDIVGSSRSLLDFQSSIESELEAELLLGRDLNLERARSAALMGDMETVAKELTKQAGDYTDFSNLNVIQQDALARSLGMQSDQLADILFKQEIQGKTARDLRAIGKDALADRLEAQTVADKFNATIEKLKGTFADVATAFLPLFQLLGDALSLVNLILAPITDLVQIITSIPGFLTDSQKTWDSLNFATDDAFGFGEDGVFAGGDVTTPKSTTFANDAMIPSSHQGGKTLLGPEGSIKFNKDDTIVAGTDLFGDRSVSQMADYKINEDKEQSNLFGDRSLSQMPDYESVLGEAKTQINPISTIEPTSTINTGMSSTVNNNQTQINQESKELVDQMKAMNASINKQTEVLAKGQNTIAKTKTKLTLGASSFGTDLNVNSFSIQ